METLTVEESLKQDPKLETVDISYFPGGGKENNHVIVNGVNVGEITTTFSVDLKGPGRIPEVTIKLAPLKIVYKGEGLVKVDGEDIPDDIAMGMYLALKDRFEIEQGALMEEKCG